jgi:hypothetical protein
MVYYTKSAMKLYQTLREAWSLPERIPVEAGSPRPDKTQRPGISNIPGRLRQH